ncbi:MAG TPA: tyrosine-type recombinase/integrase [Steroidobacteraceae bacterium]|nr:tyrosine-type recombinase/integrase [Steroidobacteraceae bacterium]
MSQILVSGPCQEDRLEQPSSVPRATSGARTLTEDQRRLLDALAAARDPEGRRDHALIATMLGSGIRVGSAVALDVEDLDLERGEVRLRTAKGDRPSQAVLPRGVAELLRGYVAGRRDGPLFPGRRGERITARHFARRLQCWLRRAGVERPASPHTLRHSFAARVYARTGDLLVTQAALGHASIASTTVYARCDRERVREAVGA